MVEQGTHEALLARNGVYAELHRIQNPEAATIAHSATGRVTEGRATRKEAETPCTTNENDACALMLMLVLVALLGFIHRADEGQATERSAANLPEGIWRDPGDMASLNLLYGAGGKAHAPDPNGTFTFVKEDMQATSPKFDVDGRAGRPVEGQARPGTPVGDGGDALSVGRRLLRR